MEALDADGNVLEPFQESEYEIIGIYSYLVVLTSDPHAFVNNLIFVPENSITEDFQDHVVGCGPMQAYNTSFRIKNGSAARFLEEFSRLPESSLLEIEFDDGGYETFASKMNNTRIVLLTAVCGTAGATIGMRMDRAVQEAAVSGEDEFSTAYTKGLLAGEERTGKGMSSPGEEVAKKRIRRTRRMEAVRKKRTRQMEALRIKRSGRIEALRKMIFCRRKTVKISG